MTIVCKFCGGENYGSEDWVMRWREDCRQFDWPIHGDRVSETTAACLLGVSLKWLVRMRKRGCGPQWSALPVAGSRISYFLWDLSAFAEAHTSGEAW